MQKGLSIIVADSSPAVLRIVGMMLRNLEVRHTTLVRSGAEAFEQLLANPGRLDCVIADATMPNGSGLQLVQSIRCGEANGTRPDMCCVLISENIDPRVVEASRVLDVNGYLLRPFSQQMLGDEIEKARRRVSKIDFAKYRSISTSPTDLGARTNIPV